MKDKFYFGISPNELIVAVGEQAGLSLEDEYTVSGPHDRYTVIRNLFRKTYQGDKIRMHKV